MALPDAKRLCAKGNHKPLSFPSHFEGAHASLQKLDTCKSFLQNSLQELGSTGLTGTGCVWMAACIKMLRAANMENMLAVCMEKQQCPLLKAGFHICMCERATTLHFFGEMQQERQRERGQTVLSLSQIRLPLLESQAIQHLQVKLLRIATVTKLGDLHPEPMPPKSCRSCGAVAEGKEKQLKTSSGTWS